MGNIMKTPANSQCINCNGFNGYHFNRVNYRNRQAGMGATIVLFTIALIVLVGAALAYASRGNPSAVTTQSARVYSSVMMQQSADYRDAYSRFIFDGGVASTMTFNTATTATTDLFHPASQFGSYQTPPPQALTLTGAQTAQWLYNNNVTVTDVGTTAADSITFVPYVNKGVCEELNFQLYGVKAAAPTSTVAASDLIAGTAATITTTPATARSSGCIQEAGGGYVFYSTLAEN
jgi:hypothetical protein